jgi:hypothetical protein
MIKVSLLRACRSRNPDPARQGSMRHVAVGATYRSVEGCRDDATGSGDHRPGNDAPWTIDTPAGVKRPTPGLPNPVQGYGTMREGSGFRTRDGQQTTDDRRQIRDLSSVVCCRRDPGPSAEGFRNAPRLLRRVAAMGRPITLATRPAAPGAPVRARARRWTRVRLRGPRARGTTRRVWAGR